MSHPISPSSNSNNANNTFNRPVSRSPKHSEPIPINTAGPFGRRQRSASLSSGSSTTSSGSDLPSPLNSPSAPNPKVGMHSPSTSPILSYFLAQSPTKSATLPFRSNITSNPVFEEEEANEVPAAAHARRASAVITGRFSGAGNNNTAPVHDPRAEKGSGMLRRLSLGSAAFAKPMTDTTTATREPPAPPPNSAVVTEAPTPLPSITRKPRRSATVSSPARPKRAPSPMGERMLKGHFDGFN